MEAYTITWTTTSDELRIIASIIAKEISIIERYNHGYSGVSIPNDKSSHLGLLRHVYNQMVAKL